MDTRARSERRRSSTTKKAMTIPVAMVMTDELLPLTNICPTRFSVDPKLWPRQVSASPYTQRAVGAWVRVFVFARATVLQVVSGAHARLHHLECLVLRMGFLVDRDCYLLEYKFQRRSQPPKAQGCKGSGASSRHRTYTLERAELALQRPEQFLVFLFGSIGACLYIAAEESHDGAHAPAPPGVARAAHLVRGALSRAAVHAEASARRAQCSQRAAPPARALAWRPGQRTDRAATNFLRTEHVVHGRVLT
jgi:hypothetical protein